MTFDLALSGIKASQADLDTTANNIANSSTTGFKSSRTEFAELFAVSAQGVSSTAVGNGVKVSEVDQQFSQGSINFTNNSLDLAISGNGFFTISNGGAQSYTRAGAFSTDKDGYVVNAQGARLQVYAPTTTGGFNTSSMTDLQLVTTESAPTATTTVKLGLNLPSDATVPTNPTFDPSDSTSYTDATSVTVYDTLGAAHTGTMYFSKTATAGVWDTRLYVDGTAVGAAQQLTFNSAGALTTPANGGLTFPAYTPATGASPLNMTVNFSGTTQYGSNFAVNSTTQDGYTTGKLTGMAIDKYGVVQAQYTNGKSVTLGQVALANFANPNGLQKLQDTNWSETFESGQAQRGQAGNSGFGAIQAGALEASNVDITAQLVNMITAQRNFQANAQAISTANQLTQTIINMR